MTDAPTLRKRLRKQSLGSNTNTWGETKLNEVLDAIDQSMDGYLAIALTGDLTLTTSNYDTTDQAKRRIHKFTGTLASSVSVTYPSVEGWYFIINTTDKAVTVKCAGGIGVSVPASCTATVYGDGVDLYNAAPTSFASGLQISAGIQLAGKISNLTAGTLGTDAVNKDQLETALALVTVSNTPGTLYATASSTTPKFLGGGAGALQATGGDLGASVRNSGAAEFVRVKVRGNPGTVAANSTVGLGTTRVSSVSGLIAALALPSAGLDGAALEAGDRVRLRDIGHAIELNTVTIVSSPNVITFAGASSSSLTWLGPNGSTLEFEFDGTNIWHCTGA